MHKIMADISTTYLGLNLKSPIIVGSSPLTDNITSIKAMEQAGAGAVVLKSLFEEQIAMDVDSMRVNNIQNTYADVENYLSYFTKEKNVGDYLKLISDSKKQTSLPIIASINCMSAGEWVSYASKMEAAGADAIELNILNLPTDSNIEGVKYEQIYFDILSQVRKAVKVPVSIKLSAYFSGLTNFANTLSQQGVNGLVLFNRFYEPDVNIDKMELVSKSFNSLSSDNSHILRWLGILSPVVKCDLAASTGIVDGETVIKNLLVGAKATMVVSAILKKGPGIITEMNATLAQWMKNQNMETTADFIGKLNQKTIRKPILFERAQFMRYFHDADYVKS